MQNLSIPRTLNEGQRRLPTLVFYPRTGSVRRIGWGHSTPLNSPGTLAGKPTSFPVRGLGGEKG